MALLLALGASEGKPDSCKVFPASGVLAKLERLEPLDYDDTTIEGDLDLNGRRLGRASFNNTTFLGSANFKRTDFDGEAWFIGANFDEDTDFSMACFNKSAVFTHAMFSDDTDFSMARFNKSAVFNEVVFSDNINFTQVVFSNSADFRKANFKDAASFKDVHFSGYVSFEGASNDFREVVAAKTILEQLKNKNSKINYNEIVILGDLDSDNLSLPKIDAERSILEIECLGLSEEAKCVNKSINIKNSIIHGNVNFENTVFLFPIELDDTTINGDVEFRGAKFNQHAYFRGTQFNNDTNFEGAMFKSGANFWDANFIKNATFTYARFNGDALFDGSRYKGNTKFIWSQFEREAWFNNAEFVDNVTFENAYFNSDVYFERTRFNKSANFMKVNFKDDAFFEGSQFNRSLNLSRANYNRLFLPWGSVDQKQLSASDEDAYLALMRNYANLGWFEESNYCYYEFRNKCREYNHGIEKITDTLQWIFYGYGVKPLRTLGLMMFSVLVFGLLFGRNKPDGKKIIKKCEIEEVFEDVSTDEISNEKYKSKIFFEKRDLKIYEPFIFSLNTLTSGLTNFIQSSIDYKVDGKYAKYVIIERLLGSLLIAILITAISKTYLIR